MWRLLGVTILALGVSTLTPARACGLEPAINGGFTVSHPRSIDVAVAVAKARSAGLLPAPAPDTVANHLRLRALIFDLRRLQGRLDAGARAGTEELAGRFSLVLVGPGLWSNFEGVGGRVMARYHVAGPTEGQAVVVTHAAVLRALLVGDLTLDQAVAQDLLVFAGSDTEPVRLVFAQGLTRKG